MRQLYCIGLLIAVLAILMVPGSGQTMGSIRGVVTLEETNLPLHNVVLVISQLRKQTITDEQGNYEWVNFSKHGGANCAMHRRDQPVLSDNRTKQLGFG